MPKQIVVFSELKSRLRSLEDRVVEEMCQVNYMTRFLSKLRECERVLDQLEREIVPLLDVKAAELTHAIVDPVIKRRRRSSKAPVDE